MQAEKGLMRVEQYRYRCLNIQSGQQGPLPSQWEKAPKAALCDVVTGGSPRFPTVFQWLRDDGQGMLYLRFEGKAQGRHSTFRLHDEPLWKQDVFELFLCDEGRLDAYRELESSPWDLRFDGRISYDKQGNRSLDMSWDAEGWVSETSFDKESGLLVSVWKLPYAALAAAPREGGFWRFGVFRVAGEELQAWQMTGEANFHVPERFGWLDFQ